MDCIICGDAQAWYRYDKFQTLCVDCNRQTPEKVNRTTFNCEYWGDNWLSVPTQTRKEFYSDYLASTYTVAEYKGSTTFRECPMCGQRHNNADKDVCAPCIQDQRDAYNKIQKDNHRMNLQRDLDIIARHN